MRRAGCSTGEYYLASNPDLLPGTGEPIRHYHRQGWREGRRPSLYFDPAWYQRETPQAAGTDPLLHYAQQGEAAGRRPVPFFDPAWYRRAHPVPEGMLALAHFLRHRRSGAVAPVEGFDAAWYLRTYPDVADAGMDPFEHYLVQGYREDRRPNPGFDPAFYRRRYLLGEPDANPLLHYLARRGQPGIHAALPPDETTLARELRRNVRPGPGFEPASPLPAGAALRARLLAYYLPQFHPVAENDAWWGEGFTEWANVARGLPRFAGHYQPRIPRDLGHYSLADGGATLRRQVALARGAGLSGFVFYFYWFDGKRLLDRPVEDFLAAPDIDFPFCLMWANENWTRRWDGSESEVLIAQTYRATDEDALVREFARHFADPRYLRAEGRPLLMIYRPELVPDTAATIARWRRRFAELCGEDPIFVMSQSFGASDPRGLGMDGAIEFPPHKICAGLPLLNAGLDLLDHDFSAQVHDYAEAASRSSEEPAPDFPLIKTAAPGWDNDARRQGGGLVLHGATPAAYQLWLERLIAHAARHPFFGERFVCINAWNEWAEGAYLEPDVHFGAAFLNATARAAAGLAAPRARRGAGLLLVGHDAFPAGAQHLLLAIGRRLRDAHGLAPRFLLLGEGALLAQYRAVGETEIVDPADPALPARLRALRDAGYAGAFVNTAIAAPLCTMLREAGIASTLLVHELPGLLGARGALESAAAGAASARRVVFPTEGVRTRFGDATGRDVAADLVLPQGVYQRVAFSARRREALRAALGLAPGALLAIGLGYADLRKGFDLFLQVWRASRRLRGACVTCLWIGDIDPALAHALAPELAEAASSGGFLHLPFRADATDYLSAADCYLLTSREDPLPSVLLEAFSAGLPALAFAGSGGAAELIARHAAGACVPMGDAVAMARHIPKVAREPGARTRLPRIVREAHDFGRYTERLLALACPELRRISVVVPSYNYARYMRERLQSIFAQTHPVLEIIVLDDASDDASVAEARAAAAAWGREVRVVRGRRNSGSVFRQWARAAALARGEWVWIAEADDSSEPGFLASLSDALDRAQGAVMAFSDSRSIDAAGSTVSPDYKEYYAGAGAGKLAEDAVIEGRDFVRDCLGERNLILNASAVLWRRDRLVEAIGRCGDDLARLRLAGDWRVYVEMLDDPAARVAYVAAPLNVHRRHPAGVTGSLRRRQHVAEINLLHRLVARRLGDAAPTERQSAYRRGVASALAATRRAAAADADIDGAHTDGH